MKVLQLFDVFSVWSPCLKAIQETSEYYCSLHLDLGTQIIPVHDWV